MTLDQACSPENYNMIYRHCLKKLNYNQDEAREFTQEVFLTLIQEWEKVKEHPNLRGWLLQTSDNKIKYYFRQKTHNKVVASIDDENFIEPQVQIDFINDLECTEIVQNLELYETQILCKLNDTEITLLHCLRKKMKYREIAAQLGKTEGAVSMLITRLRRHVNAIVNDIVNNL